MRYAGAQPVEVRDPNQIAAIPMIVPIAKGVGMLSRGHMINKATGITGLSGGYGTLDDAIQRGESGLEREEMIRMNRGNQGQPTGGNAFMGMF